MEKLYFMVTADELEWPIAVGRSIEELAKESGKSEMAIYFKMRNQSLGRRQTGYKVEVVEVEK
ncbi:MAG: hypothetical protein PUG67_03640 [Peptoniphilaceae bacterium]|nr:hypothetical protein [Peptoniphilaceae bacterium]MDY6019285.1 hypothetical protein [Anaerococcus sp.]